MRPKEIQEKLGIDANRIKLFKKESIFIPENPPIGNRSTNYTDADYRRLQLIVTLTKCGLTCANIRDLQNGERSLESVIHDRQAHIEEEIAKGRNSLKMLSTLLTDQAEFSSFDVDHYWGIIQEKESDGEEFYDVFDMYGYMPISLIRDIKCPYCGECSEVDLEDYVYDQCSDEHENGMGPDIVYSFDSDELYECQNCGRKVHIHGWAREYPIGAYDSEEVCVEEMEE